MTSLTLIHNRKHIIFFVGSLKRLDNHLNRKYAASLGYVTYDMKSQLVCNFTVWIKDPHSQFGNSVMQSGTIIGIIW